MDTPILFLVFNRPELTKKVFERIRERMPKRLYIVADGPRKNKISDVRLCEEVRNLFNNINWPCEIFCQFRNENLGCKESVSKGIDWFFQNEEEGIILEDDVLPNSDFFDFCEHTLKRYRDDERVMMITGTNYLSDHLDLKPYTFSEHFNIWGWATWRRAWILYDVNMTGWTCPETKKNLRYKFNNTYIWHYYRHMFDAMKKKSIDTWDIQWVFTCLVHNGLCILPRVNLISNIGVEGAHSNSVTTSHFLEVYQLKISNKNYTPKNVLANAKYDSALHALKSLPIYRRSVMINVLDSIGIKHILSKIYFFFQRR